LRFAHRVTLESDAATRTQRPRIVFHFFRILLSRVTVGVKPLDGVGERLCGGRFAAGELADRFPAEL